jgi:hypothetical protein
MVGRGEDAGEGSSPSTVCVRGILNASCAQGVREACVGPAAGNARPELERIALRLSWMPLTPLNPKY